MSVGNAIRTRGTPDGISDSYAGFKQFYAPSLAPIPCDCTLYYLKTGEQLRVVDSQVVEFRPIDPDLRRLVLEPLVKNGLVSQDEVMAYYQTKYMNEASKGRGMILEPATQRNE